MERIGNWPGFPFCILTVSEYTTDCLRFHGFGPRFPSQLARGWKDDPETLPWLKARAQSDEHADVRRVAVEALARGWKDDPEVQSFLSALRQ